MIPNNDLAEYNSLGTTEITQLFAGEMDIITDIGNVAANTPAMAKYTLVARDASRNLVPCDPAASDSKKIPVGVLCQPVALKTVAQSVPIYIQAWFNFAAITWPASITTLTAAQTLLETTTAGVNMRVSKLRQ
jgi:hypothetical protein